MLAMDLSNNSFSGELPISTSLGLKLQSLRLANNKFLGVFPSVIETCRDLVILDLGNNMFFGDMPSWIGKSVPSLQVLSLPSNNFSGVLPPELFQLSNLQVLDLSINFFSGEIPMAMGNHNCNSLVTLDIGNNRFSGGIPTWIGSQLPYLKVLRLRSNNFTGEIPMELSWLPQLQLIDMANNRLIGSIPVCFGNLTSMTHNPPTFLVPRPDSAPSFQIMRNGQLRVAEFPGRVNISWKGREQTFQDSIGLITGFDLSCNRLTESIPEDLTYLKGLRFLNLSRNDLSGSIPEKIGSLELLDFLDLSCNELSGTIPPSISNLRSLGVLNLSNNHLWGRIPTGDQLQTFVDPSIYGNNPGLCGFPLLNVCEPTLDQGAEVRKELRDLGLWYSVILGFVFGFWIWFGTLFFLEPWRFFFLRFIDGLGRKIDARR
ncbi:hypothetical protein CFC21_069242 [Triticum aestivum]|uniref:Uncharacterized protein n=3 Tax=Triticum TaxID=4564 RepID=A0A9R1AET5_TRITD|nr:hypothetical protein CFC21_069242 [Triticum aestivum]VAI25737.1 unnamed protein product [Triticum turgidum subsp. durum]